MYSMVHGFSLMQLVLAALMQFLTSDSCSAGLTGLVLTARTMDKMHLNMSVATM